MLYKIAAAYMLLTGMTVCLMTAVARPTEEEKELEDREQIAFIKEYNEKKKNRNKKV